MRHGTCFHRRLSAHHAGAAPHSAVAELGVVRRYSARLPRTRARKDIPSSMTSSKLHGFQIPSSESPASSAIYLSAVPSLSRGQRFRSFPGVRRRRVRPEQSTASIARRLPPVDPHAAAPSLSRERAVLAFLHSMRRVEFSVSSILARESIVSSSFSTILMQRPQRKAVTPNHALQRTAPGVAGGFARSSSRRPSRGAYRQLLHTQQLHTSRQSGRFWLSSIPCVEWSSAFPAFWFGSLS